MATGIILLSLLGLSLGSFISVCCYRIPRGISVVTVRSFCINCRRTLRWYELIPIISFFIFKGNCERCSKAIPLHYPATEFSLAALTVGLFQLYGATGQFLYSISFITLMFLVAVIDWRHLIIPNKIVVGGIAIGLLLNAILYPAEIVPHLFGSLLSVCLLLAILVAGSWLFKKRVLGMGDVKLSALIGLFLGLQSFLAALWLAAIMGALYGIFLGVVKNARADTKLPFGTFLAVSSSIVLLLQEKIMNILESWLILNQ